MAQQPTGAVDFGVWLQAVDGEEVTTKETVQEVVKILKALTPAITSPTQLDGLDPAVLKAAIGDKLDFLGLGLLTRAIGMAQAAGDAKRRRLHAEAQSPPQQQQSLPSSPGIWPGLTCATGSLSGAWYVASSAFHRAVTS